MFNGFKAGSAIHPFVITLIFAATNPIAPFLMIQIPPYRAFNPCAEVMGRNPLQLILDLRRIDRISPIVPWPVLYESNQLMARFVYRL